MTDSFEGRFFVPGMLLLGAAGRKVGKTELACRLLRRHANMMPIYGLKVTAIDRRDAECPRGGKGCGVCASLTTPWCLTTENDATTAKDTSRLLAAGAHQVHWLRVLKSHLDQGASEMLRTIGPDAISICESNSLRNVIEPGLFLQVRSIHSDSFKTSAKLVSHLADRIVVSNGTDFDLSLDHLTLLDGQWALFRQACAIIVADGDSQISTEDPDSSTMEYRIQTIAAKLRPQFSQILLSTDKPEKFYRLNIPIIPPLDRGGPLMTLANSLRCNTKHEWNFVISCTCPPMPAGIINALFRRCRDVDAIIPVDTTGRELPFFALYHKRILDVAHPTIIALGLGDRPILLDRSEWVD